ncbi:MAG: protein kinase domain-containing protein, partial [Gemmataceae bacterium]
MPRNDFTRSNNHPAVEIPLSPARSTLDTLLRSLPAWKTWLYALGRAIWQETPQALIGLVPFGDNLYRIGERLRANLSAEQKADESRAALTQLVVQPQALIDAAADEIADAVAPEAPPEVRRTLARTLELAPAVSRRSLRRAEDPHGRTVPATLRLDQKGAMTPFVPAGPPRFQGGQTHPAFGGWVLRERFGVGGFAEVWKITHPRDEDLSAAVKFFLDDDARGRLGEHEVAVLRQVRKLGHGTGVVRLEDFDEKADPPWIRFEYVADGDLLHHAPHFFGAKATAFVGELAEALGRCHRLTPPVVHRDIKPGNVLMVPAAGRLRPVIADFGIGGVASAWALSQDKPTTRPTAELPTILTGSHTALYASPQQRAGARPDP